MQLVNDMHSIDLGKQILQKEAVMLRAKMHALQKVNAPDCRRRYAMSVLLPDLSFAFSLAVLCMKK